MTEKRRERKRRDIEVTGVFDIETEDWTTFVCGGVAWHDGGYQAFDWKREDVFVDTLLGASGDYWAHNGGRFDLLWLLDHILKRDIKASVMAAGSRIVALRVEGLQRRLRFFDSKALTKISLKELTENMHVSKERLGFECVGKEDCEPDECEGYCAIRRDMPAEKHRRLLEYLEADCKSLIHAMQALRGWAGEHDLDLSHTVGSAAWANARRILGLPDAKLSPSDHRFARLGYFGGRVQLFRPFAESGWECDVNAMYPSRLAFFPLPWGEPARLRGPDASRAFAAGRPGVYRATVHVPPMHLPPLPFRAKERVAYPTGRFEGVWCAPELQAAEKAGAQIEKVHEGLVWPEERVLFRQWVDKIFDLRKSVGKKTPFGQFLKFYSNSPTGKMGARPDVERVIVNPEDIVCCPGEGEYAGEVCTEDECCGLCGAYSPLTDKVDLPVYTSKTWRLSSNSHVEWSGYLTAYARVEWRAQAVSFDGTGWDMVYGDTDSNLSLNRRTRRMGDGVGEWEDAGAFRNFHGRAPKMYDYEKGAKGLVVKAKGIHLPKNPQRALEKMKSGKPIGARGPKGFWSAAREGQFFQTDTVKRRVGQGYGDRLLDGQTTRAPRVTDGKLETAC